jgi:tRNA nucleotidyltransferase/poly(A) polymerase
MTNLLLQAYLLLSNESPNTYLVGGCVRDMLLGKTPKDFDIVTDVPMDRIQSVFESNGWVVDAVGMQFLVMFVKKRDEQFEIANFRKDVGFSDGRRPDKAEIGTLQTDAARRDFTVNSIYYNPMSQEFLDPNNGRKDLANRVLKFIGKPHDRIREDYLRIYRFYRFLATTGFTPDKKSLAACRELFREAHEKTTAERIRNEIERMVRL